MFFFLFSTTNEIGYFEQHRRVIMNKIINLLIITSLMIGAVVLSSCSSSPSAEELRQLSDLKASVQALEKQIGDKKSEKARLEKQVAEKNGKLQQCQSDQEVVKKGLGK